MIKIILGIAVLALTSAAACQQNTTNTNAAKSNQAVITNSSANSAAMNHNSMNMNSMNHNSMSSGSMNHSTMESSPNAASAPYDLQFIDTMTDHHQGAVEMAKIVLQKTNNAQLKKFAENIIADQTREITAMKEWRDKWYAGKPAAINMEMSGMADSMQMMMGDGMKKFEAADGKDFDLMFLEMMTPHHAGAVTMGKEALQKAEHPEIKTLANNIIKAQEAEIKQMAEWKAKWSK